MAWHELVWTWLRHSAPAALTILLAGSLAALVCRQPARRLRAIEWTLLACLAAPLISMLPGLPRWAILPPIATHNPAPPIPATIPPDPIEARVSNRVDHTPPAAWAPIAGARPSPSPARPVDWLKVVAGAYLLMVGAFTVRWLIGLAAVSRLVRSASPASPDLCQCLRSIAGPGADRVALRVSRRIEQPLALGLLRPTILLPQSIVDDASALRYALAHEWAHVERRDVHSWQLAGLVQALFFYLPPLWWLRRQLRLDQDYLADARAAGLAPTSEDYAEFLIRFADRIQHRPPAFGLGLGDRGSPLSRRVAMLLANRPPIEPRCPRRWSLAFAVGALSLVAALGVVRLAPAAPQALAQQAKGAEKAAGKPSLIFSGEVVDETSGRPVVGAEVTVTMQQRDPTSRSSNTSRKVATARTADDGKYRLSVPDPLADEATRLSGLWMDIEHPEFANADLLFSPSLLSNGRGGDANVEITRLALRPAQPISGQIVDAEGKPVVGAKLAGYWALPLIGPDGKPITDRPLPGTSSTPFLRGAASATTDEQGRFRLKTPDKGEISLVIAAENAVRLNQTVKGRGDIGRIELKRGQRIRGRVVDSDGRPLEGVPVSARSDGPAVPEQGLTDRDGSFTIGGVLPASYAVIPSDTRVSGTRESSSLRPLPAAFSADGVPVTVREGAGDPEPVTIRALPSVAVRFRMIDSAGKPIANGLIPATNRPPNGPPPPVEGQPRRRSWLSRVETGPDGRAVVFVPRGMPGIYLLLSSGMMAARFERPVGTPIPKTRGGRLDLGMPKDDDPEIVIREYRSPELILKVATRDGSEPKDLKVGVLYEDEPSFRRRTSRYGEMTLTLDPIYASRRPDSRLQVGSILPDAPLLVSAEAEGYRPAKAKLTLTEGERKEMELILEK